MVNARFVLIVAAVILFIIAAIPAEGRKVDLKCLAFACLSASLIV